MRPRWIPAGVVLIVSIDLASAAAHALPSADVTSARLPEEVLTILSDRKHRVLTPNPPPVPILPGTAFEAQVAHRARHGLDGIGRIRSFQSLDVDAQRGVLWDQILARTPDMSWTRYRILLARAGVRYYLSTSLKDDSVALAYPDLEGGQIFVHEVRDALPYVRVVSRWQSVSPEAPELMGMLSDASLGDEAVVLETAPGLSSTATASSCSSRIDSIQTGVDTISASVRSDCPALFIAQEIARPRWRARVDGKDTPLATVDLGYVAVPVPRGDHRVEIEYAAATRSWWPLSLLGISVLAALACAHTISRRDKRRPANATKAMQYAPP